MGGGGEEKTDAHNWVNCLYHFAIECGCMYSGWSLLKVRASCYDAYWGIAPLIGYNLAKSPGCFSKGGGGGGFSLNFDISFEKMAWVRG